MLPWNPWRCYRGRYPRGAPAPHSATDAQRSIKRGPSPEIWSVRVNLGGVESAVDTGTP